MVIKSKKEKVEELIVNIVEKDVHYTDDGKRFVDINKAKEHQNELEEKIEQAKEKERIFIKLKCVDLFNTKIIDAIFDNSDVITKAFFVKKSVIKEKDREDIYKFIKYYIPIHHSRVDGMINTIMNNKSNSMIIAYSFDDYNYDRAYKESFQIMDISEAKGICENFIATIDRMDKSDE